MKPFIGNPCMHGLCMRADCEDCPDWSPCIYFNDYKWKIRLPKWSWLVNQLYRLEGWLLKL